VAFSASDAALEGFRIAREKPLAILGWAVVQLAISVISSVVLVTAAGPALQTYSATAPADAAAALRSLSAVAPAYALMLPLILVGYAVQVASVNRVVLRPQERGFLWLKLGADEMRQVVVLIVLGLLLFAAYMAAALIAGIVVGVAIGGATGGAVAAPGAGTMLVATSIAMFAAVFAMLAILAKLSLASPMTFDLKRIEIFASWRLTQGRFWPLFGAYVMAFVMLLLVAMLVLVIFAAIAALATGGVTKAAEVFKPTYGSLASYFTPLRVLYLGFGAVISGLTNAIWFGVAPRAYQQLKGPDASVF
jgi:hypothetical protein